MARTMVHLAAWLVGFNLVSGCGVQHDNNRSSVGPVSSADARNSGSKGPGSKTSGVKDKSGQGSPVVDGNGTDPAGVTPVDPNAPEPKPAFDDLIETETESRGWGGSRGDVEATYTSPEGLVSRYRLQVPRDSGVKKPYGLLVYVHDDGEALEGAAFDEFAAAAGRLGLIPVAVRSPNDGGAWRRGGTHNAAFLRDAIKLEVFKKWNVLKHRVIFAAKGGGAQFLSAQFVPTVGAEVPGGGAILLCGGNVSWAREVKDAALMTASFPLIFSVQKDDFVAPQVKLAQAFFKDLGLDARLELSEGSSHCGGAGAAAIEELIRKHLP